MPEAVTIQLDAPIRQVAVLGVEAGGRNAAPRADQQFTQKQAELDRRAKQVEQEYASRRAELEATAQALHAAGKELASLREEVLQEMRREAVSLAMDVARKVLQQEIASKGYDVDAIVSEALSHLPKRGEITVHLHPDDFERSGLARSESAVENGIRFTADPSVSPAGCLVHSAEGSVESDPAAAVDRIEETLQENM
ncbi:MAG: hypothetical protein JW849_11825 [Phycisphaerae bacterium]|nr:hypothetical protein [Phycisphaerae bacterium]